MKRIIDMVHKVAHEMRADLIALCGDDEPMRNAIQQYFDEMFEEN